MKRMFGRRVIGPSFPHHVILAAVTGSSNAFDPTKKAALVDLSNNNLTAAHSASSDAWASVGSLNGVSTGKVYFTVVVDQASPVQGTQKIGLARGDFIFTTGVPGQYDSTFCLANQGHVEISSGQVATAASYTTGDTIGVAFDRDNWLAWFKNITAATDWNLTTGADPATGTGGLDLAALGLATAGAGTYYAIVLPDYYAYGTPPGKLTINFNPTGIPSGFSKM